MAVNASLGTIVAFARAGALDHAWLQFCEAGYDRCDDDPAALAVKGRLLKDFGLRAKEDGDRRRYFLKSSEAYRQSAVLRPGTYPLINAATLSLLSGDQVQARDIAREVLDRIAFEPEEPETPYWRAATEAEALLLLGRGDEARAAIECAVAAAPEAWEDHASTLRQFIEIEHALGVSYSWLDRLRPARSIRYAAGEASEANDAGFGFGSLAAGSELDAAEALLERGVQLHVILPSDPVSFAARFVDPHGAGCRERFDDALAAADSVRYVRPLGVPPSDEAVALAACIAWGAALLNAEELMGEAAQVGDGGSADAGGLALLALRIAAGHGDAFQERLGELRTAFATLPAATIAPHLDADLVIAGYADIEAAAVAARGLHDALHDRFPIQLAAHHGLIDCVSDPFSGAVRPTGSGVEIVRAIAGAAPPSTICVSDDFACVLAATTEIPRQVSRIGEIQALDGGSAIGLYALSRNPL